MPSTGTRNPSNRTARFILYFFFGCSALVYQIVWARMLGLIIGTAVNAWAAALAAYMGGMALGSAIGGKGPPTASCVRWRYSHSVNRVSGVIECNQMSSSAHRRRSFV